ncbi:MAG: HAD family hydrolase [Elainellaceae cyanobacterium]
MDRHLGDLDPMLNAILFDLDGTLADTDPIHFQIWKDLLHEYGLEIDHAFYQQHISGRLNIDILRDLLPHLSEDDGRTFSVNKEAEFRRRAASSLTPLAGLMDLLNWVSDRQLKRAVVTNAPPDNARFMLKTLGLDEIFPVVVLGEDVAAGKPHPMPYQEAMRQLDVTPTRCLAFEDSPSGIQSAVGAGILTIGVATTHDPQTLEGMGATLVIRDFTDARLHDFLNCR